MIADYRRRLGVCMALTLPVLVLSPMVQAILGFHFSFRGDAWVSLALSTVVFLYGGWPFLSGSWSEVRKGALGMMTLIAVAIATAYVYSVAVVFGLAGMLFFWELVTLIDIMLLGHIIEMRSVMAASNALELLVKLMPDEAHLIHGDHVVDVKLTSLKVGDVILIKSSEKIPADGVVVGGNSHINESMLTGESMPVRKTKDDHVIGGSINGNGSLQVRVERTGEESYLHKVVSLVKEAQQAKSNTQHLADRAARWLTYGALGAGALTFITWLSSGADLPFALERMVTVMVISCPHALGLAIPLVVAYSTYIASRNGLLIRDRTAFENARRITSIVLDKTGTLTTGEFGVTRVAPLRDDLNEDHVLRLAASLENNSEHPIASGIVKRAQEKGIVVPQASDFEALTGKGVRGTVEGKRVSIMSPSQANAMGIVVSDPAISKGRETIVLVMEENEPIGAITLADPIRPSSKAAVGGFHGMGIKTYMATGDNEQVARYISAELGLDGFHAQVLPHEKVEVIKRLQAKGEVVAMAGDGVNDAPALAQADVGVAVGSGTDVAASTADIILVRSDPKDILQLVLFGRATYRKMVQNLWWAAGYNVIAIPLAAGVLHAQGIMIGPALGAVLMSMSTVVVAVNARLLKLKTQRA
jgi:Cu2+-exporting ATPase